jgi:predicted Rdx family selenoprotein
MVELADSKFVQFFACKAEVLEIGRADELGDVALAIGTSLVYEWRASRNAKWSRKRSKSSHRDRGQS